MTAPRSALMRVLTAALVGGALVGVAAGTDAAVGPRTATSSDPAVGTEEGAPGEFVSDALLTCPGVLEAAPEDAAETSAGGIPTRGTWLRAAAAPEDVFEQETPSGPETFTLDVIGEDGVLADSTTMDPGRSAGERTLAATIDDARWAAVRGGDAGAPGIVGAQLSVDGAAGARGLSLTPCSVPTDVAHLVGGGAGAGRVEQIVVTNPAADPVTVDIEVFGEQGAVQTVGGTGLVVPAQGRLVQRLDALGPAVEHPVVRVVASGGPVVAHLADRHREGTTDLGFELTAAAAAPAHELVVPGIPAPEDGDRSVSLRIFAADEPAVVELRALTAEGAYTPSTAAVRVPAGSTVQVLLDDLPDGVNALRLRADAPVTAGALVQLAPTSQDPIVLDPAPATAAPDDAATTAGPDEATTAGPDDAATTAGPDDAATTAAPDGATSTTGPDEARHTSGPDAPGSAAQSEPVRRPAGEHAWVAAVPLSQTPVGIALPDLTGLPGGGDASEEQGPSVTLAVSVVDATTARILWLDDDGGVRVEEFSAANDTTGVLEVPARTTAVWVVPDGPGVAAALHVSAQDVVGPYLAAAVLPQAPWTVQVPTVVPVLP